MKRNGHNRARRILSIDVGGSKVKFLVSGEHEPRKLPSGPKLTPSKMVEAVRNIDSIRREDCRNDVLEKFNVERMVDDYEALYGRLIQNAYEAKSAIEESEQGTLGHRAEHDQGT